MDTEGFTFFGFNTGEKGLRLVERTAPTPSKKEIKDSVPFMNGNYDFSRILGEDSFDNRELTFKFIAPMHTYKSRKNAQTVIENALMRHGVGRIDDTHDPHYHYLGKCVGVTVTDDERGLKLDVTVTFDCYPFKIGNYPEGDKRWDSFNFDMDILQDVEHEVDGEKTFTLHNLGVNSVVPEIHVTGSVELTLRNRRITISNQTVTSPTFRLMPEGNTITAEGNGTVSFLFYKELI